MTRVHLLFIYILSMILFVVGFIGNIGPFRGIIIFFFLSPVIMVHYILHAIPLITPTIDVTTKRYSALSHLGLVIFIMLMPESVSWSGNETRLFMYTNPPEIFNYIAATGFLSSIILSVMTLIRLLRKRGVMKKFYPPNKPIIEEGNFESNLNN